MWTRQKVVSVKNLPKVFPAIVINIIIKKYFTFFPISAGQPPVFLHLEFKHKQGTIFYIHLMKPEESSINHDVYLNDNQN